MIRFILTFFLVFIVIISNASFAYAGEYSSNTAKFIYNLVDHIKWKNRDNVNICSYGFDKTSLALSRIDTTSVSKVDRMYYLDKVTILNNIKFEEINNCGLLYISKSKEKDVAKIIEKVKNSGVITISAIPNFTDRGGIIELKIMRRKIKLKLNEIALDSTGIHLSPVILLSVRPEQTNVRHTAERKDDNFSVQ